MYRRQLLLATAFAALAFAGCGKDHQDASADPKGKTEELRPLTVDQVEAKINAKDGHTFVFDDNPQESWKKAHVPTAKWLDDENVTASALPADKGALLIFYCHNET